MAVQQQSDDGLMDQLPIKLGAIVGAVAFVVGYVLTYVLLQIDSEADLSEIEGDMGSATDVVAWIFYNAHFVDTKSSMSMGGESMSESENMLSEASLQFPDLLYHAVPIVVLIGAGYLLVTNLDQAVSSVEEGAKSGAAIAAGYLPLAVVASFIFTASGEEMGFSFSVGPDTVTAIILAGLAFPIILGAIGGYVAATRAN